MSMKLDTSRADKLFPCDEKDLEHMDNKGAGTLPYAFYQAFHEYRDKHPVNSFSGEAEEYFQNLRQHIKEAMIRWLDEHDGKVDRWPHPQTDFSGIVVTTAKTINGRITEECEKSFVFSLFGPGFTEVNGYKEPRKPIVHTENVDRHKASYWAAFNKQKEECEKQEEKLDNDRNTAEQLRRELRITPVRLILLLLIYFLGLNALVGFVYAFTGLFDYEHLVSVLGELAHNSGSQVVRYLVWPIYALQVVSYFVFKGMSLRDAEGIFMMIFGALFLLFIAMAYYGTLLAIASIVRGEEPFSTKTKRSRMKKLLKQLPEQERSVKARREKVNAEKCRLEEEYPTDPAYLRCVQRDKDATDREEKDYPDVIKAWTQANKTAECYLDMLKAYYRFLVNWGIIKDNVSNSMWEICYVKNMQQPQNLPYRRAGAIDCPLASNFADEERKIGPTEKVV